jgi:superfamily II DNA or RNA helicase
MNNKFKGWSEVAIHLEELADNHGIDDWNLNEGQQRSLHALASRLPKNGVVVADEVGMGKTRIAVALANAVNKAGGRVAIVVPPPLGYQWQDELQAGGVNSQSMVRSLWQFLKNWEDGDNECSIPWFKQDTVIISHSFCNWKLSESSDPWRWALLPEVFANLRKENTGRFPNGYHDYYYDYSYDDEYFLEHKWIMNAGKSIVKYGEKSSGVESLIEDIESRYWPSSIDSKSYSSNGENRGLLEKTVGLGFGEFDLIIIDEAHKSRSEDSILNRLLNNVLVPSGLSRRLAMTATPIELAAKQWEQIFSRINVEDEIANSAISEYEGAINAIRKQPNDNIVKKQFSNVAEKFYKALSPYLLRRDKREEKELQDFSELTGKPIYEYRKQSPIAIEVGKLSPQWKRIVCAAESLSFTASLKGDSSAKRLRLTLSNGHGIDKVASTLDDAEQEKEYERQDKEGDVAYALEHDHSNVIDLKRKQRTDWWKKSIRTALEYSGEDNGNLLFNHPAILKTVDEIEKTIESGEKVLVFGRFTQPMRALNSLLNARALLRHLEHGELWPQAKLREDESSDWDAIQAAYKQLNLAGELSLESINFRLNNQYKELEKLRASYRSSLIGNIENGFAELKNTNDGSKELCERSQMLFRTLKILLNNDSEFIKYLAIAMIELTGLDQVTIELKEYGESFISLINALADKDEGDFDGDGKLDSSEAIELWGELKKRIKDEYSSHRASYSRLMVGGTPPSTKRMLQLAFNRKENNPKVLIAQSMVGREGLNLHLACKTVILFHLEWNPGVVEQQIGRVDRVNSLWSKQMKEWSYHQEGECPQIQVRPVIFKGTYDEMNWDVLSTRWKNLQAQLHGMVITPDSAEGCSKELIEEINSVAPRFSP